MAQSKSSASSTSSSSKRRNTEPDFPVKPTVIQLIKTARGVMNHSYRDFSKVPAPVNYEHPKDINRMTFSQKVHHILSQDEFENWISWMPHGRAFKVHVPVMFESNICPKYFGHKRYSSFLRELNNYGFKHISKGSDRNCYYHEFMLKGRPHLCQYMPPAKDARRLVADPQNEPNFYRISRQFPLDGEVPTQDRVELPAAKRARNGATDMPQGLAMGAAALGATTEPFGINLLGAQGALFGQTPAAGPAAVSPETAALISILEAQNKKREEEKQRALLAAALLQHRQQTQQPIPQAMPSNSNALAAMLGMLGQH